jgi:hypothetical protein
MNMRVKRFLALGSAVAAFVFAVPTTFAAASTNPCTTSGAGVVPLAANCDGITYAAESAEFWKYVLAQPASTNPLLDPTGGNCQVGQSGQVFFLVGSFVGTVDRTDCQVPAGKTLFFPLVNTVDLNTPPGLCGGVPVCNTGGTTSETPDQLRSDIKPALDGAHDLFATIDGKVVPNPSAFRVQSPVFGITLGADNLAGLPAHGYMSVADGYYVMVAPLAAGRHTIHFGGVDGNGFTQDVTYHLKVLR